MNKKAQVSIEVLAILGILVVGAIIFGVYYLSMARKNIDVAAKLDIRPGLHIEDGPDAPGVPIVPPYSDIGFTLDLTSSGNAQINTNFSVLATVNNYSIDSDDNISIKNLTVTKYNGLVYSPSGDCNYGPTQISPGVGLNTNLKMNQTGDDHYYNLNLFSCSISGDYKIKVYAVLDSNVSINDDSEVSKEITDPPAPPVIQLDLNLFLVPTGTTNINTDFGILMKVDNYLQDKNVVIKDMNVYLGGSLTPNCSLSTKNINDYNYAEWQAFAFNKTLDDYNLLLSDFNCSVVGSYNFSILVGEKNLTNSNQNDIGTISKAITDSSVPRQLILTLDTVTDEMIMPGFNFDILANVNYYPNFETIIIKEIRAYKSNTPSGPYTTTSDCYYDNHIIPTLDGFTEPIAFPVIPGEEDYNLLLNFYCCSPGNYKFEVKAGIKDSDLLSENDDDNEFKVTGCEYTYGTGTLSNPKQIWNPKDLFCVRYYLDSNFVIKQDIDMLHKTLSDNLDYYWYDHIKGWDGIGNFSDQCALFRGPFTGDFNGNNMTISNLYEYRPFDITYDFPQGLFAKADSKIYDLTITDANIFAASSVGTVVGYFGGDLRNIAVSNSVVRGYSDIGGLVGTNFGDINKSRAVNITVIGELHPQEGDEGGYQSSKFGGLVGHNKGMIDQSYATGNVTGTLNVGGLVGRQSYYADSLFIPKIENSYSKASVSGFPGEIGGLIGQLTYYHTGANPVKIMVKDSYSIGAVSFIQTPGASFIGGLIGLIESSSTLPADLRYMVRNSLWDKESSLQETTCQNCYTAVPHHPWALCQTNADDYNYFGWGQRTYEMKDISTFNQPRNSIYFGFGQVFDPWSISSSSNTIWNINSGINQGYPYLRNNPPPEGE